MVLDGISNLLQLNIMVSCFLIVMYMFLFFQDRFKGVGIRVRVRGGGNTSQIYAIRQSIAKSLVAYYQKCEYLGFLGNKYLFDENILSLLSSVSMFIF